MKTRKKYKVNIARVRNIAMRKVLKIDKLYFYTQRILIPYTVDGLAEQSQGKQTKSVQANSLFKSFYFSPILLQPRKYDNQGQFSTAKAYLHIYQGCQIGMQGPQLCAEPHHICKLDVATSRMAFLDLNLHVLQVATSNSKN